MEKGVQIKKKLKKLIVIFMGVMLFFTILSKSIYTYLLPVVELEKPTKGTLETKMIFKGKIGLDEIAMKQQKVTLKSNVAGKIIDCKVAESETLNINDTIIIIEENGTSENNMNQDLQKAEYLAEKNTLMLQKQNNEVKLGRLIKNLENNNKEFQNIDNDVGFLELNQQIEKQQTVVNLNEELYREKLISENTYNDGKNQLTLLISKKETLKSDKVKTIEKNISQVEEEIDLLKTTQVGVQEKIELIEKKIQIISKSNQKQIITSPVKGEIYQLNVTKDGYVDKGEVLGTIIPDSVPYRLNFEATNEEAEKITIGQKITFEVNETTKEAEVTKKHFDEVLDKWRISCTLEEDVLKSLKLGNQGYKRVNVTVAKQANVEGVIVSNSAIQREYNNSYVYILEEHEDLWGKKYIARRINIKVLEEGDYKSAVEGMIKLDDQIIKVPFNGLKDGVEVALNLGGAS